MLFLFTSGNPILGGGTRYGDNRWIAKEHEGEQSTNIKIKY
jgi:hypothetical protein